MSVPDTNVKHFHHAQSGAPTLSSSAGSLISVLDACLINGFGSITLDSLAIAGNVATGTISTGHNLAMHGNTGPVIAIAGATPAALNGEWRLASVPSATQFTFTTTGISNQTATGTITAKRAPAGWTKEFSGTNLAAYRNDSVIGTGFYVRVDDTVTQVNPVTMYESMSDISTGQNPAATWFTKAYTGYGGKWWLYADSRMFYLFSNYDNASNYSAMAFGDLIVPGIDPYGCVIVGNLSSSYGTIRLPYFASTEGSWIARNETGIGSATAVLRRSHSVSGSYAGNGGAAYPNLGDKSLFAPIDTWNPTSTVYRGTMPGLFNPLHPNSSLTQGVIVNADGHDLILQKVMGSYCVALDINGPWRPT